jgi:HEAT repeat protein
LKYASDANPELRAAAAWALSATETHQDLTPQLIALLKQEADPEVRVRLYEALGAQDKMDKPAVLALARAETNPAARQAGFGLLADACRADPTPDLVTFFDTTAVPELKATALSDKDRQSRLSAVLTLRRARTELSANALQEIASKSDDQKIVETAQAALNRGSRK